MPQLRRRSDKRHHDVRHRLDASGLDVQRRLEDGPGLHHGDLGVLDAQTAATQPQHGVHLRERKDLGQHRLRGHVQLLRHARDYLGHISLGQELVERGIKKADGDGEAVHGSEDALEVAALEGEQLRQRLLAPREVVGHDHLPHRTDALFSREEHVLGAHQPDALRAVAPRRRHVLRGVRVPEHFQVPPLVRPRQEAGELFAEGGWLEFLFALDDLSGGAVDGDPVALAEHLAAQRDLLGLVVDQHVGAAAHARLAPPTRHYRRVRRHPAALRQDALGRVHAPDVVRARLSPHQQRVLAVALQRQSVL
mmetsp:Transcript_14086/g.33214  ORF Transcript_14086/g.33214 Transcript_14086/m.33214 type:complete len:308 (+) Transcript_14086:792-1715(+)